MLVGVLLGKNLTNDGAFFIALYYEVGIIIAVYLIHSTATIASYCNPTSSLTTLQKYVQLNRKDPYP